MKKVQFWSEGTRLAGDLYQPPDMMKGERYPAIVICHGWGQTKDWGQDTKPFHRHAEAFAAAGYMALTFDMRGWGESDGKVVVTDELPKERTETTVRVQVIRELVDPFDEAWDIIHAVNFLEGEPGVDPGRIGLWGTSFGGGLVIWVAAHDERVKCVVSQVGLQDTRRFVPSEEERERVHRLAIEQARGEVEPIPQRVDERRARGGTPHRAKMRHWAPVEFAEWLTVPVLLIDAEDEPLFDRHENSELVYKRMQAAGKAPVKYHVVQGAQHLEIYEQRWQEASELAITWFDEHLSGATSG